MNIRSSDCDRARLSLERNRAPEFPRVTGVTERREAVLNFPADYRERPEAQCNEVTLAACFTNVRVSAADSQPCFTVSRRRGSREHDAQPPFRSAQRYSFGSAGLFSRRAFLREVTSHVTATRSSGRRRRRKRISFRNCRERNSRRNYEETCTSGAMRRDLRSESYRRENLLP